MKLKYTILDVPTSKSTDTTVTIVRNSVTISCLARGCSVRLSDTYGHQVEPVQGEGPPYERQPTHKASRRRIGGYPEGRSTCCSLAADLARSEACRSFMTGYLRS